MKKLILAIALLTSTAVIAEEKTTSLETCQTISELAGSVMEVRQSGASMVEVYKSMSGNELAIDMVVMAYDQPKFSTDKYRAESITSFSDQWFTVCIKLGE